MTKNSSKSLISRPGRKTTSQNQSSLSQRSITAASKKTVISPAMLEELKFAHQLESSKQWQQADQQFRKLTSNYPNFAAAWHDWGLLTFNAGQLDQASQLFSKAVALDPSQFLYHRNLGEISRRLGRLDQAISSGKLATQLAPKDPDAHYNLGLAYTDSRDYKNAAKSYRSLIKINPQHGLAWNNLGAALEQLGNKDEAFKAYSNAVQANPNHAEAQNNLGALYYEQGQLPEARASFEKAVDINPGFVIAHYNLSSLKAYTPDDRHLAMMRAVLGQEGTLDSYSRMRYHFALGKALEDVGDVHNAFASYQLANQLERAQLPYDELKAEAIYAEIIQTFDRTFFEKRAKWEGSNKSPIFIVGMPRSGTSLLEQILATHPSIYGAGELTDLNDVLVQAISELDPLKQGFASIFADLSEADFLRIAKNYCERVWKLSPKSRLIVDKMPANFFYLGMIYLLFPRAKVIHIERDPMDTCFSCFARLFNHTMDFAYDLDSIGRYYVRYKKLMNHWHSVLPREFILDVKYEDLVSNLEFQTKRIMEFIGEPWSEACLEFYANTRNVKTASIAQVRKPLYQTSVARWRPFAPYLRSLYELIKPFRESIEERDDIFILPQATSSLQDSMTLQALESAAKVLIDRCIQLQGQQDHLGALRLIEEQFSLVCQSPVLLHLQGISFYRLDRFNEAIKAYEMALALQPEFPAALNSLGFVLQDVGRMEDALKAFERALQIAPEFSMARLNLGLAQLKLGDWESGWENYEARWTGSAETASPDFKRPNVPLPQWDGQEVPDQQALLVITEQGFGDTFQFSRFLLEAKKKFARVGFACSQPTQRLLEWAMGNEIVLLISLPTDYAVWDWYCPLMSLPRALKVRVEDIPSPEPYFPVPLQAKNYWAKRLEALAPGRMRVGIAWTGRKTHQYDSRRSIRFEQITQLLQTPYITWVSLQKWGAEEIGPSIPSSVDWIDLTPDLMDFADTAALLSNLDFIISVDSSLIHLAGMMGTPAWMLNRFDSEWRWLGSRSDSPWYPNLRIFNQPKFGDWTSVLELVGEELHQLPKPQVPAKTKQVKLSNQVEATTLTTSPLTEQQAMEMASQLQSAGRPLEAEQVLRQLISANPSHGHGLHLLGVAVYQLGRYQEAISYLHKAVELLPNQALFQTNLGEMLRQQGQIAEAIRWGEKAVKMNPMLATAHSNLGIALYDHKEYTRAEEEHHQALALDATLLQSLNNMGSIERAKQNRLAAIEWYEKVLSINANYIETLSNLGAVLVESDRADEAAPLLERGLVMAPTSAELLSNLGLAYLKQDKLEQAKIQFNSALAHKPNYATALTGLAAVLNETDELNEAEALLKRALVIDPEKLDAYCQLGIVQMQQGKSLEAKQMFEKALEVDPKSTDALAGLGNLCLEFGKADEAEALLKKAIVIDPDNVDARFHLSQVKKVKPKDENLSALEAFILKGDKLSDAKKISLYYALGKSYDDIESYDKAFENFTKGAQLKRAKLHYDADADEQFVKNIIATVDSSLFNKLKGNGNPSHLPIFVLGMPRSGTTLTEQIIASHPEVFGAGELPDLAEVIQTPGADEKYEPYPQSVLESTPEKLTAWGAKYCERLQSYAPSASRITDKMPSNYLLMGLIPLILPNAKIIHVKRNPVDTCLSCFTRLFNRHQEMSYDLAELGRSYVNYALLMDHWKRILPKESFLEVQYEDLVSDIETQARRLIKYCDLPWDDKCLSFYQTKRNIRTASVTQVRQPIYATSVERWRHYEKHLMPLLSELKRLVN